MELLKLFQVSRTSWCIVEPLSCIMADWNMETTALLMLRDAWESPGSVQS